MVSREEKIRQIARFVKEHPESFASRTVIRRFVGTDYEFDDEFFNGLEQVFLDSPIKSDEIDSCYDLIK